MALSHLSGLSLPDKRRYWEKVEQISKRKFENCLDPYQIPDSKWIDDVSLWPPVEFGNIYSYLIKTPGLYTQETMQAYKSLEAYNYYSSGWVQTVFYCSVESNSDVCLLKAKVKPSQRVTNSPHNAWVATEKKSGVVLAGHCTCMAGCGEVCSHVAATLFKVEACIRLGIATKTCTSLPCLWNQTFSSTVEAAPVYMIDFRRPSRKRSAVGTILSIKSCTEADYRPRISKMDLLRKIYSAYPSAVVFKCVPEFNLQPHRNRPSCSSTTASEHASETQTSAVEPLTSQPEPAPESPSEPLTSTPLSIASSLQSQDIPPVLSEGNEDCDTVSGGHLPALLCTLYDSQSSEWSEEELKERCLTAFKDIRVSRSQALHLFESTKQQASSELWFEHRMGRITASYMHDAFKHTGRKYPSPLLKSILRYSSVNPEIPALKWGRENEERARNAYLQQECTSHANLRISLSGFVVNPAFPYLGASPDGICSCDCCPSRLLEIKCPYKYRFEVPTSAKALSDKQYCLESSGNGAVLKTKHKYYSQVQGQLLVTGFQRCDFVCWTTDGIFVQSIEKDKAYTAAMLQKLRMFFSKYILPELLTRKVKADVEAPNSTVKYCYCNGEDEGKMIECENPSCSRVWFHFSCVGIKRTPRGSWYCKDCKP